MSPESSAGLATVNQIQCAPPLTYVASPCCGGFACNGTVCDLYVNVRKPTCESPVCNKNGAWSCPNVRAVNAINVPDRPHLFLGVTLVSNKLTPTVEVALTTKGSVRSDGALSIMYDNIELFLSDEDGLAGLTTTDDDKKSLMLSGLGSYVYNLYSSGPQRIAINQEGP